jgi:NAD(P)H-dependent FMN reductase
VTTLLGIAGSLRRGSYNKMLLRAAAALAPDGCRVDTANLAGIPLYDADVEREQGIPPAVAELKERVAAADGLLLATPEYNNSMPGVFKNAIDWLSRPPKDIPRVFGGKPVALIGATPGKGGTRLSQAAWLPVLRTLGTAPWNGRQLYVAGAGEVFDDEGELVDDKVRSLLARLVAELAEHVRRQGGIPDGP